MVYELDNIFFEKEVLDRKKASALGLIYRKWESYFLLEFLYENANLTNSRRYSLLPYTPSLIEESKISSAILDQNQNVCACVRRVNFFCICTVTFV